MLHQDTINYTGSNNEKSLFSFVVAISISTVQTYSCIKTNLSSRRISFAKLPNPIQKKIVEYAVYGPMNEVRKNVQIFCQVCKATKDMLGKGAHNLCVRLAMRSLFAYARVGDVEKMRQRISYLVSKNFPGDYLFLSRDEHERTLIYIQSPQVPTKVKLKDKRSGFDRTEELKKLGRHVCTLYKNHRKKHIKEWQKLVNSVEKGERAYVELYLKKGLHPDLNLPLKRLWVEDDYKRKGSPKLKFKSYNPPDTPFYIACDKNFTHIASLLFEHGADPSSGTLDLPLNCACRNKNLALIKKILACTLPGLAPFGYFVGLPEVQRMTVFEQAITKGFFDEEFLDECVRKKIINVDAMIIGAIFNGAKPQLMNFLFKHNVNINFDPVYKTTPLIIAARLGNKKMVHTLIEMGADVNIVDHEGHSALSHADCQIHEEQHFQNRMSKRLRFLKKNMRVNKKFKKYCGIMDMLIKAGASKDYKKKEPIIYIGL